MARLNQTQQAKKIKEIHNKEEEFFVERVSKKFNLPYINLVGVNIETDALIIIPESKARKALIAPFKIKGKDLYIGVKSPNLPQTKEILAVLRKEYNLGIHMVSKRSLEKAWARYADVSHSKAIQGGMLDISSKELEYLAQNIKTNDDIKNRLLEIVLNKKIQKTTQLMEVIFAGAIATGSSDVHIEAQEEEVRLRFRQDGVLHDLVSFDHESYRKLLSRIKLLSKMKLTQTQNAQDGRFTIDFNGKEIEVRVSVIPSAYGESFVMRILNPDGISVGLESLGIERRLYEILLKEIKKPNGMILTTGPTGSGKTTTLYSFMNKVYSPEIKILTIEDPIEYHLSGINQTQVNRSKDYDFLSGLRAALRQDPDIVMIGEIRDRETAKVAVNASLTGHLVLSTLHTNSAAGVIPRLIDLGISPQILAASLSVSLAQRLVRKVCEHCKYTEVPNKEEEILIRDILIKAVSNNKPIHEYGIDKNQNILLTRGRGCEQCNNTGYKGRIGLFEVIITDDLVEELLNKKPSEQEVRRVAEKQGLLNIREDGVVKILNGVTSLEEVRKVIDLDIQNITKEETKKKSNTQTIQTTQSFISGSDKNTEMSLLIDYLRILEQKQTLQPDIDITEKINLIKTTIIDILENTKAVKHKTQNTNTTKT